MNMFGAEPGAGFSPPTRAEQPGGELRLTLDGSEYLIRAGQTARIGRAPDNDLVTEAPTVSRHHGVLRWGATGWEFENAGSAPTFVGGQQVTRVLVDRPLSLVLGSPDGPVLQLEMVVPTELEPPTSTAPPAAMEPPAAMAAGPGVPGAGVPGTGVPGTRADGPGAEAGGAPAGYPPAGYQQAGYDSAGYAQGGYEQAGPPPARYGPGGNQQAGYQQAGFEQGGYAPGGYPPPPGSPPSGGPGSGWPPPGYPPAGNAPGYPPAGYPPAGYPPGSAGWGAVPPGRHSAAGGLGGDEVAALRILFPIQGWMHNSGWRQGLRLLVIAYALLPLIFLAVLSSSGDLSSPGWAYSIYVAPLWLMGFWMLIRPGALAKQELLVAAGIVVWTLIWINVVTININDSLNIQGSISFFPALLIGFNEEITKALPVLLAGLFLLRFRSVKLSVRMTMYLGTIAGLTFGIAEQAFYTSNDIVGINQAQSPNEAVNAALAFAERIFIDGFQHAVWAGIAGFFIGMALNYPRRRIQLILLGVTTAAVLHALNDFLAGSSVWLVIIVQLASLLLFLGYTMSSAMIEEQVRESPLFRGDSLMFPAFRDGKPPAGL